MPTRTTLTHSNQSVVVGVGGAAAGGKGGCGVELEAQLLRYASCTTHGHASREGEEEERETPHRLRHTQTRMPAPLTGVAKRVAEQRRPAPSAAAAAAACTQRAASQLIDRAPALQRRRDPCLACQERRRAPRWAGARVELSTVPSPRFRRMNYVESYTPRCSVICDLYKGPPAGAFCIPRRCPVPNLSDLKTAL